MDQISEQQINQIRDAVDIVEVISNYLPLINKGKNYFGVCPFHDDHSPSMSVSKEKQIYRCFSCGAGGNVFKFIMDYENISFIETVKMMADKADIPLQISERKETGFQKNEIYYQIYETAERFYQNNISASIGKEARLYLDKRGFGTDIIKEFGIGLSLKNTELLTNLLQKKGFDQSNLVKSGLVNSGDMGLHDVYYNRILFPLWDINGRIVGFSGRIYNSSDTAKYINTKETEVFKKGELLYNYHRSKNAARQLGSIIVMEGFMDVIRAYTVGISNVIATMGTAVTKNQALLIKRMAKDVILCFDGDAAGAKASITCSNELLSVGVTPKIVRLEEGLDPDEYIQKYGKKQFEEVLENAMNIMDFKLRYLKEKKDLTSNHDMASYVNEVLKEVTKFTDEVLKELTLKKLSEETDLDIEFLKKQLEEKDIMIPIPKVMKPKEKKKTTKYEKAEQNLLYYMVSSKQILQLYQKHITYMPTQAYRALVNEIICFNKETGDVNLADLMTFLRHNEKVLQTLQEIISLNLKEEASVPEIMDYIKTIQEYGYLKEKERLRELMISEIDKEKKAEIGQRIVNLKKQQAKIGELL